MIFIGQTRFSVFNPRSTSFLASNGSKFSNREEYRSYLYSEERLDVRTDIFLNHSLPQLELAIDGHDVPHIVTYSDSLPEKYQRLLEEAAESYPFLVLDRRSPGHAALLPENVARYLILEQAGQDPAQAFGVYSLDDDDLLPVDFFDQNARHIKPENAGRQVSFATGITALYVDGAYYNARRCHSPLFSAGLMNICRFEADGTLVAPSAIPNDAPGPPDSVIIESRDLGYFRVRHVGQDTSLGLAADDEVALLGMLRDDMDAHPAATHADIESAFPVVARSISLEANPGRSPQTLLDAPRLLAKTAIHLPLPKPLNRLELTVDMTCGAGAIPSNALVSLDLINANGTPVDPESLKPALRPARVALSGNPSIGFFRYLQIDPGRQESTHTFELPPGVVCRGLSLRLWRRYETAIILHNVTVSAPAARIPKDLPDHAKTA
ncbi:glycosyltransferase [Paeniglutamicibacter sp. NPDC012692]|uniref:glycosyltransferase n=1 Tax=Paeniglutamicibacter sp. NPDC012692 TaxID=3364388 RepID=UPI0036A4783C